jgi:hypothetical protein
LDQNREPDGGEHEKDGRPGRHFGKQVGCTARTESSLGSLAAKGAGEVSTLALLEKNNSNQDEANDNVNGTDKPDHAKLNLYSRAVSQLLRPDEDREVWFFLEKNHEKIYRFGLHQLRNCFFGAEGGT